MKTAGAVSSWHAVRAQKAALGKGVEQHGGEAGESTLTMATMFLTAFAVQVSEGAKREEAFSCMHTVHSRKHPKV